MGRCLREYTWCSSHGAQVRVHRDFHTWVQAGILWCMCIHKFRCLRRQNSRVCVCVSLYVITPRRNLAPGEMEQNKPWEKALHPVRSEFQGCLEMANQEAHANQM